MLAIAMIPIPFCDVCASAEPFCAHVRGPKWSDHYTSRATINVGELLLRLNEALATVDLLGARQFLMTAGSDNIDVTAYQCTVWVTEAELWEMFESP